MQGAFVLTAASFVAKLLSAIYRVPYQNFAGDEGFYVYQQVYPIYGIAMTLALSGLPQFISKYVAEQKEPREQRRALEELFPLISAFGLILWALFFFSSQPLANWMGDRNLAPLIQVVYSRRISGKIINGADSCITSVGAIDPCLCDRSCCLVI